MFTLASLFWLLLFRPVYVNRKVLVSSAIQLLTRSSNKHTFFWTILGISVPSVRHELMKSEIAVNLETAEKSPIRALDIRHTQILKIKFFKRFENETIAYVNYQIKKAY